jgi:hypothetical protein
VTGRKRFPASPVLLPRCLASVLLTAVVSLTWSASLRRRTRVPLPALWANLWHGRRWLSDVGQQG